MRVCVHGTCMHEIATIRVYVHECDVYVHECDVYVHDGGAH